MLRVRVLQARALQHSTAGESLYTVTVAIEHGKKEVKDSRRRTAWVDDAKHHAPRWNEYLETEMKAPRADTVVVLSVAEKTKTDEEFVGRALLPIARVPAEESVHEWLPLAGKRGEMNVERGELHVVLLWLPDGTTFGRLVLRTFEERRVQKLRELIEVAGDKLNADIGKNKYTLVHLAAMHGYVDIVVYLCDHYKCSPRKPCADADANTPLHLAAANGHLLCALALAELGCSRKTKNGAGKTPADVAKDAKHKELAKALQATTT